MRYRAKKLPLVPLLVGLKVVYFGSACMWIPYSYSLCHGWPWLDKASLVLLLNAYYSFSKRGWLLHLEVSGRKSVHFSNFQHWQLRTALVRFSPFHEAVRNCILFMRPHQRSVLSDCWSNWSLTTLTWESQLRLLYLNIYIVCSCMIIEI